ncbi:13230_t:CDS:2, partial [Racocetra fulgida]
CIDDYDNVINLIRKEKNLKDSESLSLILQIDEFQTAKYLRRNIGLQIFHLSPMDFKDSMLLFDRFIGHFANEDNYNVSGNIYRSIVNSIRGIPSVIEVATKVITNMKNANLNAFENYQTANTFWRFLRASIKEKYSENDWLRSLQSEDNILKLLFYIHIQKPLKKDDKFDDSTTIDDFETSDLIFLEQSGKLFIPRAPLVLISILADYLKSFDIFNDNLLNPFDLLTEETFPQFILHMHHVTYTLVFRTGLPITIRDIYGGHVRGLDDVLNSRIDVQQSIEYHVHASLIPKTNDGFIKPGLLDRQKLPVISSNKEGYKEIDVTSGRYLVLLARRTKSADAITPHADEQYKFSLALESGQPIHTSSRGKIGVDIILEEEKKAKEDIQNIPDNCIIVAGKDLFDFVGLYADVVARIAMKSDESDNL